MNKPPSSFVLHNANPRKARAKAASSQPFQEQVSQADASPAQGQDKRQQLPAWLRRPLPSGMIFSGTRSLLSDLKLATVCQGAKCPNIHECFSQGTATFLILGHTCTRNCAFCNIEPGSPGSPELDEPARVAQAAAVLKLEHVVITSVTRDDLPDGGAAHFAATIKSVRARLPQSSIEVLIPDFQGSTAALGTVLSEKPTILNHNVETHPALYLRIRPQADYLQSLTVLRRAHDAKVAVKSGFMVGLGESDEQIKELLADLARAGCAIVTIGQYMRPSLRHLPVARYVHPDSFMEYARWGKEAGIAHVFSSPLVRSSYQAKEVLNALKAR